MEARAAYGFDFALQLFGDVRGKTVVNLQTRYGSDPSPILESMGARVIRVDISDCIRIPLEGSSADRVFCSGILRHEDSVAMARQIRRILTPGGIAVFTEPKGSRLLNAVKRIMLRAEGLEEDVLKPLNLDLAGAVSRAVGRPGRRREPGFASLFVWEALKES